jgi:hypothetical protein
LASELETAAPEEQPAIRENLARAVTEEGALLRALGLSWEDLRPTPEKQDSTNEDVK